MGLSQRAFRDSEIEFERPGPFIHQPWQALAAQVNISSCLPACLFTFSHCRMSVTVELQSLRWVPKRRTALQGKTPITLLCSDQLLHSSTSPLNKRTVTRCHSNDCLARDIGTLQPTHRSNAVTSDLCSIPPVCDANFLLSAPALTLKLCLNFRSAGWSSPACCTGGLNWTHIEHGPPTTHPSLHTHHTSLTLARKQ